MAAIRLAIDMRQHHAIRINDPISIGHRLDVQGLGKRRGAMPEDN
jgi:hypothetical protein